MFQLLLMLASLKVLFSLPRRKTRTAADYPGVSEDKFLEWHKADLHFAKMFPLIALCGFVLQYLVSFILAYIYAIAASKPSVDTAKTIGFVGAFVTFLVSVGWIHSLYSTAQGKKRAAGIADSSLSRTNTGDANPQSLSVDPVASHSEAAVTAEQGSSSDMLVSLPAARQDDSQAENTPSGY